MKRRPNPTTLRRSVALPGALIGELKAVAPPELRTNLNRLVIVSLQEYVARRRREEFERAVAAMAEDPQIQAECAAIARDFEWPRMNTDKLATTSRVLGQPALGVGAFAGGAKGRG
jgi:hypothetical protein